MKDDELGATLLATVADDDGPLKPERAEPPSLLADRYEVLALIGQGGMGRVYRVHDRALDETVALKMLRREVTGADELLERFRREVKLARLVTSPHVVRTFDLGQHAGEHFLTMEYVAGRSLSALIEEGPLSIEEVLRIGRAIAAGIAAAHAAKVLHRDLKPDNVLVATTGRVALTDFGIARVAESTNTIDELVGTPAYMAPEQVDGRVPVSPATDTYAFGAILFEMLTGKRPFTGETALQLAVARLDRPPPDPRVHRAVPDPIAELVVRCMALDPAARPQDGAALIGALANLTAVGGSTLPPPAAPIVPAKGSRAVAVLPLRAPAELAELADGLGEEIVDGLTLTRALRVRPMQSVRGAYRADADPREIGQALGVDVVVDGSLRKLGELTRITARAISVADGFQLSADRIDARPDELMSVGDVIARAVAKALTVDLPVQGRAPVDPRAIALYLEGKAKLSAAWMLGPMSTPVDLLQRAHDLAPDDASIEAALASARARSAFTGAEADLALARRHAERAVERAPEEGDAWLALGQACMYANEFAAAGQAMYRAVRRAPGLALAQAGLGSILLEAGSVEEGNAHLAGALAIDPTASLALWDLARGTYYAGQPAQAIAMLDEFQGERAYAEITIGRLRMWQGERFAATSVLSNTSRTDLVRYALLTFKFHRTFELTAEERVELESLVNARNPRLVATRAQFVAEFMVVMKEPERAMHFVELAVASGLQDHAWMTMCPLLAGLRSDPRFASAAATVAERARIVRAAIASA